MIDFEEYNKIFYDTFREELSGIGEDEFDIEIQIDDLKDVVSMAIYNSIDLDYIDEAPLLNTEHAMSQLKTAMKGEDLPENNIEVLKLIINDIDFHDEKELKRAFYKELARVYLIEIFRRDNNHRLSSLITLINIQNRTNENNEDKPNNENGRTD